MARNLEGGGHELDNGIIVSGEVYDKLDGKPEKKVDVKRIKRDKNIKDTNNEAVFEFGEQETLGNKEQARKQARIKKNNEKLRKKTEEGYAGGKNFRIKEKLNNDSGEEKDVVKEAVEDEKGLIKGENINDTQKEEAAEKLNIGKSKDKIVIVKGSKSPLEEGQIEVTSSEKIAEERERIAARFREKESNRATQEEKPEIIDVNNLEERQEMEELAKQLSPELKQEFLERNEEAMREGDEIALEKLRAENKELYNHSKDEFHLVQELDIKNTELKANFEKVSNRLSAMESAIEKSGQEFETKDDSKFEKVKKFFNNPKVKLAITVGLMGAAYTVGGGAPAILAFKPLLAKIGIGYIPYTYGVSSWGGGAIAGGAGRWLGEKFGLVKNEKDAKTAVKEVLENISAVGGSAVGGKNPASEQLPAGKMATEEKTEGKKSLAQWLTDKLRGRKELTLNEKRQMREIARKNNIDIIGTGMSEDEVLKDYEKRRQEITDKYKNDKNFKEILAELEKIAKSKGFEGIIIEEKQFHIANTVPDASGHILDESTADKVFVHKENTRSIIIGEEILNNIKNLFETDKEFAIKGFTSIIEHEKQHNEGSLQRLNVKKKDEYDKLPQNADFETVASINLKNNKESYPFEEMQTELQRINVEYKDADDFVESQANHYLTVHFAYQYDSFNFYRKHGFSTWKGFSEESSATRFIKPDLQKKIIARMEEMRQSLVEKYTKPFEDEAKNLEQFLVKSKAKEKGGKEIFDYFSKLSKLYDKSRTDFHETTYDYYLKDDDLKRIFDSMLDYLRKNNLTNKKEKAKIMLSIFYHGSADAEHTYSFKGKKDNVEWLGWKYKGFEK